MLFVLQAGGWLHKDSFIEPLTIEVGIVRNQRIGRAPANDSAPIQLIWTLYRASTKFRVPALPLAVLPNNN